MKKVRPYLLGTFIVLGIFLVLFISKGIFPFGNNSLIWSDMHDQITAFYYHFYDSFVGNNSLFINFSTSGGANFLGILAYYIISPFNFILFLFDRDKIYLAVSLIIVLKVLASVLTSLYFIRYYFKKIPWLLSVTLALLYGFSGYTMSMYIITPWMDALYMFPLILIGLKKTLDLESPLLYILTLTISIILCFYISYMIVIFIFFASLIYILVYKNKEERKKSIVALGITTILALLLSFFIVYPTYNEISLSSRLSSSTGSLLNSKAGPIIDKTSFFTSSALYFVAIGLLLLNYKQNKKILSWYLPTCLIVLIPYVIEAVNKIWHYGTYAFFPYRFGFIAIFMLLIGACIYFNKEITNKNKVDLKIKLLVGLLTSISSFCIIFITSHFYQRFQEQINHLTISKDKLLIILLLIMMLLTMIVIFTSLKLIGRKLYTHITILIISIVNITSVSFLYFGIDFDQKRLTTVYKDLQLIEKDYQKDDYFRVKNISLKPITNNGMVMRYHNLDHFTSLTDGNNLTTMKLLGHNSVWTKIYSNMGTEFTDLLLANKYLLKDTEDSKNYYNYKYQKTYGNYDFYVSDLDISYGYFLKSNPSIKNEIDTFKIQNKIYESITSNKNLFTIHNDFKSENLKITKDKDLTNYKVIDQAMYSYLEKEIKIKDSETIYLNLYNSLNNMENICILKLIDIYVNDKLFIKDFPDSDITGTLNLGTYKNETVKVRVVLKDSISLRNISIGVMNQKKLKDFSKNYKINNDIKFIKNKIKLNIESSDKNLLFIPLTYNEGYSVKVNGKTKEVLKVFDNYLGVEVENGQNEIIFTFVPPKIKISAIISFIALIIAFVLLKFDFITKLINNTILQLIAEKIYISAYLLALILIYIVPTICFIISFFVTI